MSIVVKREVYTHKHPVTKEIYSLCGGVGFAKSRCAPLRHTVPWTAD
ncbi:hypothetical protein F444_22874 [Phytophthora nicotianae P1976]|uniref:Uncharacterized protein n=1 Tax=Phytophthora nicotianae P1976 TaxID=1317066 RepID=A0A080YWI3_PHYNI|nr:hypothetical protein F444_22874 [Phytophthora nicotianae P1976]